jgi:hypothetical protein
MTNFKLKIFIEQAVMNSNTEDKPLALKMDYLNLN